MNLFETIKEKVSVPDAAKRYNFRTAHHDMAICPFHDDRHPSLRLNRDYFYCYGCGAHGDVIGLVSLLFGLSPYEASLKLASDFGIDLDKPLYPGLDRVIEEDKNRAWIIRTASFSEELP